MPPHPLTNFQIQKYYQNEPKFKGVYSRNILPKIKDETCVINLDEQESIETHWIFLYVNVDNVTFFDGFGVRYIPKETKKFMDNKNFITNIYKIQTYNSIMDFCIGFIDFMLKDKSLLDYTNLLSPNECEKVDKIMLKCFK